MVKPGSMAFNAIGSVYMQRLYGHWASALMTVMIEITAFAATYAMMLGYSRIPYAAALDGAFFRWFGDIALSASACSYPADHALSSHPGCSLFECGSTVGRSSLHLRAIGVFVTPAGSRMDAHGLCPRNHCAWLRRIPDSRAKKAGVAVPASRHDTSWSGPSF